jgi:activating signal cointegrator complex subunit 3
MAKHIAKKQQFERITSKYDEDTSHSLSVARQLKAAPDMPRYPFVYDAMLDAKVTLTSLNNQKIYLPETSSRKSFNDYEEVTVKKMDKIDLIPEESLVDVAENFDAIGQVAFAGCKRLNPMQSVVFDTAYRSNKNMLVAAPTGAGKTNVAMMAVLNELRNYFKPGTTEMIDKNCSEKMKIIYIAPMKSLATEQTENFNSRLKSLGIKTRELTGDMSMTEREISQTHIIVTTPEKWDVVTRKSKGDIDLLSLMRLLIIDEVHLLQSDRGPVLEALVARTLRYVESSQKMTRIIGLSATLPNYVDVAAFLCVNPYEGLFYFDNRFRPVPLTQTFIGVRPLDSNSQSKCMDKLCYNLALQYVSQSKQLMIFVHARNSTQRVATKLREMISLNNKIELFQPNLSDHPEAARSINTCRNKLLRDLFNIGFGVHHAGMVRQDRLLVERLFRTGVLKVLVCTATLAWGVNFPAHAVIIRGTEIYDASAGKFVDVGLLDVMQIFGRAGRPQYDTDGHAIIMTAMDKMDSYLRLLTNQTPIESNFVKHLTDNLNAEIVSGTVSTVTEGMEWLCYTYLNVRLAQNPLVYGYDHYEIESDPSLVRIRNQLIVTAAKQLEEAHMCRYNQDTGELEATDLGLIASHYYINYATVTKYNELINDNLQPQDILMLIGEAQEFQQIKYREEEAKELDILRRKCYLPIAGGVVDTTEGKVNCLLQAYITRAHIETHSLISDLMYIAQNATRIARGLFEYSLKRGWPTTTMNLLKVCKMLELRTWDFHSPFRHFDLPAQIIERLEQSKIPIERLETMSDLEVGKLVSFPEKMGKTIKDHLCHLPYVVVDGEVKPVKSNLVKLNLSVRPYFKWNDRYHGKKKQSFWLWVTDHEITQQIYYSEHIKFSKEQVQKEQVQNLTINIPLVEDMLDDGILGQRLPCEYVVYVLSDDWIGCDYVFPVDCRKITLTDEHIAYTRIPPNLVQLPLTALQNENFANVFRPADFGEALSSRHNEDELPNPTHSNYTSMCVEFFNVMQSQVFFSLYRRDRSVLVCGPPGSGKTLLADLAALRVMSSRTSTQARNKIFYVAALDALAQLKYHDWRGRLGFLLQKKVVLFSGQRSRDLGLFEQADIIVTSAERMCKFICEEDEGEKDRLQRVALIVLDDLHMLNDKRCHHMRQVISKLHKLRADKVATRSRLVGLSNTIANPQDLAQLLSVKKSGAYNFHPATSRSIQLEIHIVGFPERHYSPRMASMNKPIFVAINTHSDIHEPTIIFVSSRKQCVSTALNLVSYLARYRQTQEKQWLHMDASHLESLLGSIQDDQLRFSLEFGIGLLYPSLPGHDKSTVLELFRYGKIQVLICTTNYAWESDLRARLIIVKGTEHYDVGSERFIDYQPADVMQMLGKAGRPNMDSTGVAMLLIRDIFKEFYKKFLFEPFPIETDFVQQNLGSQAK